LFLKNSLELYLKKIEKKDTEVKHISWWHLDLSKMKTVYLVHLIYASFTIVSTHVRIFTSAKISDRYRGLEKKTNTRDENFLKFHQTFECSKYRPLVALLISPIGTYRNSSEMGAARASKFQTDPSDCHFPIGRGVVDG